MNANELWKAVLGDVETQLSSFIFKTFFLNTRALSVTDEEITIVCNKNHTKEMISKNYFSVVNTALKKIAKKELKINFKIEETKVKTDLEGLPLMSGLSKQNNDKKTEGSSDGIISKYTFENFIVGPSNRLAHAIAVAITENPGKIYNPFFLHAGVGLGKTHLIQAIGNKIIENNPSAKIVYATAETFMNELIEAIQEGRNKNYSANKFRNKFRKADVLLIDDIQFIAGRGEATQEEFFHTFNALYMGQKQIVLTSDRPPKELSRLDTRITSRFASGVVADMQAPDVETRSAILREKRDLLKAKIPNEVVDYIASLVATNIRELEGAFLQVITTARAEGEEVTKEYSAKVLGQNILEKQVVGINDILRTVCTYYNIKMTDIKGERRVKEFVVPRQVSMYLLKLYSGTPYMAIGDLLGGRDHTTIMHGHDKIAEKIQSDMRLKQDIGNIKKTLNINA